MNLLDAKSQKLIAKSHEFYIQNKVIFYKLSDTNDIK